MGARVGDGRAIVAPGVASGRLDKPRSWGRRLVADGDALRLYHCAKQNSETNMSIGLLVSESGDVAAGAWRGVMWYVQSLIEGQHMRSVEPLVGKRDLRDLAEVAIARWS